MTIDQPLAVFKDRNTLVYERTYPHSIDRVFEAVTTGEHLDAWMCPESRVERRLGGACAFGWGGPSDGEHASRGVVTVFEPQTAVEYTFDDNSYMRFDLVADGAESTHLNFTLHFLPAPDAEEADWPGSDFPVPGTAWQPGFCAGYHIFLDDLRAWLRGELDVAAKLAAIECGEHNPDELAWVAPYREHIRANCPPA